MGAIGLGLVCATTGHVLGPNVVTEKDISELVPSLLWVLLAALLLGVVSFLDDRLRLLLGVRLAAQGLAAAGLVLGAGLRITDIPVPAVGTVEIGWFAAPFSILLLMWMTNLYNFMDGMDGLAGGMAVIGFGFICGLALASGHPALALVALCVVAASTGFLAFNMPPAKIFMGDIGSIPLGFLAGGLALAGIQHRVFDPWVPAIIFSPFIVDATVTLLRRAARGEKVWQAHREHYYQRAVLAGLGHKKTVIWELALMLIFGTAAVWYARTDEAGRLALIVGGLCFYAALGYGVSMLEREKMQKRPGTVSILRFRRPFVVALHLALIVLANYLAFWLRFDGEIPAQQEAVFRDMLPWLILLRGVSFVPFRLYEGLWRYTSIWDLRNIIGGVLISSVAFFVLVHWGIGLTGYPRSIFIIDAVLLMMFLGGVRLSRRIYREMGSSGRDKRMLIFGAGDAGEMIVRDMRNNSFYGYEPIGFVDDDPMKVGQRIHGIKVMGTRASLARIMAERRPDAILVAMLSAEPRTVRGIVKALEPFKVPIKTLPNLRDVLSGTVEVSQIRNLSIEDLLDRAPVGLDPEPIRRILAGKRVLVTGAGGSIGAELCRQIVECEPASLVMLDRYENGLHAMSCNLTDRRYGTSCEIHTVIADAGDPARIDQVFTTHRPQIVFHAAAHKHVPLMEGNPCEAVKNNILGTKNVVEAAERHGAERFVLISTDKAVNPTSVMGATKRVAEFLVQGMNHTSRCVFAGVRFGNVLGSNGSVVPRFLEQIKAGGPVTVTHPDMRRFFMLIPEAVQLVLQAATLARGGEIFVLEMGDQIRLQDMARNLIRLSGCVPDEEIPIRFIGLRPGEKLFEELTEETETMKASEVEKIRLVLPSWVPTPHFLEQKLHELQRVAGLGNVDLVKMILQELVPSYKPGGDVCSKDGVAPPLPSELQVAAKIAADARQVCSDEVAR